MPEPKPWHDEEVVATILRTAFDRPDGKRGVTLSNGQKFSASRAAPGVEGVWFLVHRWDNGLQGRHFEVTVKEVKET